MGGGYEECVWELMTKANDNINAFKPSLYLGFAFITARKVT